MIEKVRLDVLLHQRGMAESREKAQAIIMSGNVFIGGQRADKAGTKVSIDTEFEIIDNSLPYVSRGGLKLEKAIKEFNLVLDGLVCADIGASTGGFTDCMLQNGAKKVYAIDVAQNALHEKLRNSEQVVVMDNTNARYLELPELVDFISVDVICVSLTNGILSSVYNKLKFGGSSVVLIKPQFEVGKKEVDKAKGVIKNPKLHIQAIKDITEYAKNLGFNIKNISYSPIRGRKGNIEFLAHLEKIDPNIIISGTSEVFNIEKIVELAHEKTKQS